MRCTHCHDPILLDNGEEDYDGMHYGCFLVRETRQSEGDREMEVERGDEARDYANR